MQNFKIWFIPKLLGYFVCILFKFVVFDMQHKTEKIKLTQNIIICLLTIVLAILLVNARAPTGSIFTKT